MKRLQIIIIIAMSLLLLTSCSDMVSDKRFNKDIYILSGVIYAGETINNNNAITIGKAIDAENGNIQDLIVTNAIVNITDITTNQVYPLTFFPNSNFTKFGYCDLSSSLIVQQGHTYTITAQIGDQTISAQTTVPDSISIIDNPGYSFINQRPYNTMVYDNIGSDYSLKIQTYSPDNINLLNEFYCMDEWNEVEYTLEFPGANSSPQDEEEYENPMTGDPRLYRGYYAYKPQLDNGKYVINLGFSQLSYTFYGNYEVRMYSIDHNYYSYLYKPEGYKYGGVHNGYGYFGSANGKKVWTKIIKQ